MAERKQDTTATPNITIDQPDGTDPWTSSGGVYTASGRYATSYDNPQVACLVQHPGRISTFSASGNPSGGRWQANFPTTGSSALFPTPSGKKAHITVYLLDSMGNVLDSETLDTYIGN